MIPSRALCSKHRARDPPPCRPEIWIRAILGLENDPHSLIAYNINTIQPKWLSEHKSMAPNPCFSSDGEGRLFSFLWLPCASNEYLSGHTPSSPTIQAVFSALASKSFRCRTLSSTSRLTMVFQPMSAWRWYKRSVQHTLRPKEQPFDRIHFLKSTQPSTRLFPRRTLQVLE